MARRKPSPRKDVVGSMLSMPKVSKHRKMLNAMHDALSTLGQQAEPPTAPMGQDAGQALLPQALAQPQPQPQQAQAKSHIEALNAAFKNAKVVGGKK